MPVRPISVKDVGATVRALRIKRQLSQESLADKAGIHVTYLSGIENGKKNPTISMLNAIGFALDVDTVFLFRVADSADAERVAGSV